MNAREILEELGLKFFDYSKTQREKMEELIENSNSDDLDRMQCDLDDAEDTLRDKERDVDEVVDDIATRLGNKPLDCTEREEEAYEEIRKIQRVLRNIF